MKITQSNQKIPMDDFPTHKSVHIGVIDSLQAFLVNSSWAMRRRPFHDIFAFAVLSTTA